MADQFRFAALSWNPYAPPPAQPGGSSASSPPLADLLGGDLAPAAPANPLDLLSSALGGVAAMPPPAAVASSRPAPPPPTAADSFEDSFGGFDVSDVPAGMMAGGGGVGMGGGAGAPMNSFGAAAPQRAPLNASAFAAAPGGASMNPFGRTAAPADPFAGLGGVGK